MLKDDEARKVFDSLVRIEIGDGRRALFWRDRWIQGQTAADIAPLVCELIGNRIKNHRTVKEGMLGNRWMLDLKVPLPPMAAIQWLRWNSGWHLAGSTPIPPV